MIEDETEAFLEEVQCLKNSTRQLIAKSQKKLTEAEKLIELSRAAIFHSTAQLNRLRQTSNNKS
jgi:hypothetical protein